MSRELFLGFLEEEIARRAPPEHHAVLRAFAAEVLGGMDFEDLRERQPRDVYATIFYCWQRLQQADPAHPSIDILNPDFGQHGWQSRHTSILVLTRGIPFVAESLRLELNRRNIPIHVQTSSDLTVERDAGGRLLQLHDPSEPAERPGRSREAIIYLEIARITDAVLQDELRAVFAAIIAEVGAVVADFEPMRARVRELAAALDGFSRGVDPIAREENRALLEWLLDDNFTFLGYEELRVVRDGPAPRIERPAGSRLGLLAQRAGSGEPYLAQELADGSAARSQLVFYKSTRRSRVHRLAYPDYVSLTEFDAAGRVAAQHNFLGMFTAVVYTMDPDNIPVVRRKVAQVIERASPRSSSHRERALRRTLEVLPRDELFQSDVDSLFATAMRIFHIQERRRIRLFIRRDRRDRFASCLLYWPRDIYCTELRVRIEQLLMAALGAEESEFTTFFSESVLVRTHFVMRLGGGPTPPPDVAELEAVIERIAEPWGDALSGALGEEFGEEEGARLFAAWAEAFPPGYRDDCGVAMAIDDIRRFLRLAADSGAGAPAMALRLYHPVGAAGNALHIRLLSVGRAIDLSDVIPQLENLGMRVLGERPYALRPLGHAPAWVHDFHVVYALAESIDVAAAGEAFEEAFLAISAGEAENDGFNRLLIGTGLGWREVAVLRAYAHYMKQVRYPYSQHFIADTLGRHLGITRALYALFRARFDPAGGEGEAADAIASGIRAALESVEQLNEDRVLRHVLALVNATLRTNVFRRDTAGCAPACMAFKLDCRALPDLPRPVPLVEIWVYSPRVEGVHLRFGKVARGGLRWSDRPEDFRTEVLGLVKAQQVKNALIVPMGAKGGFVPRLLRADASRDAIQAEGVACYRLFVQSLLDLTDNIVDGKGVPPAGVRCHDGPDPYLVVAADKGTASFSDVANEISARNGFWLRDAFASGGSVGYDHKKMAITARGAWVAVERHFRERGMDIEGADFTVVGIGDMSGDVFGNGLLRSRRARLVAAFNHQHIFVDPDPDAAAGFRERERLFALPRSSWADYDATLISAGGGVFARSAKSIAISPQMQRALAIEAERLTPSELVSAILAAPVDLLWNGGIGTYFKAAGESHADAGDKANDAVRIDAGRIRAAVIGEGGNLGMTQLARIEYAAAGGACNTDFIDNSGGVNCSDLEVNIKILLDQVVAAGEMTERQRARLLEEMREEVADLVLRNNYRQVQAIGIARHEARRRLDEYRALMNALEARGLLDRALEFLPADEVLSERAAKGRTLTRPELAVLGCYVKNQLKQDLLQSDLPEDPLAARCLEAAFPRVLVERFRDYLGQHRLRREIIATRLANDVVDLMGITFVERMCLSTGAGVAEIVRAWMVARDVFELVSHWRTIESLDRQLDPAREVAILCDLQRLIRLAVRWFVNNRRGGLDAAAEVARFAPAVARIRAGMGAALRGEQAAARERRCEELRGAGLPEATAEALAASTMLIGALGIVEVAGAAGLAVEEVAACLYELDDELGFHWFGKQVAALEVGSYWQALARESFLDELDWQVRAVLAAVVRCEAGEAGRCMRWMAQHQPAVERWRRLLDQLRATPARDYAMCAVAVRSLLQLAQGAG